MKKPTHGGSRKGAGRPPTTHSRSTPIVSFRLGADRYAQLKAVADNLRLKPNQAAQLIVVRKLLALSMRNSTVGTK